MATTPQEAAAKWKNNLSAAGQSIVNGVNNVTVAPGVAAARQKGAYVQGVNDNQDKWARNVAAVPLNEWQTSLIQKGVPRIASGAAMAEGDMGDFFAKLFPYQSQLLNSLPARGGLEQNIQRSAAFIRGMANFSR